MKSFEIRLTRLNVDALSVTSMMPRVEIRRFINESNRALSYIKVSRVTSYQSISLIALVKLLLLIVSECTSSLYNLSCFCLFYIFCFVSHNEAVTRVEMYVSSRTRSNSN